MGPPPQAACFWSCLTSIGLAWSRRRARTAVCFAGNAVEGFGGQLVLGDRLDEQPPRGPGLGPGPGGHDGVERLAPAAQVVVGHPAREAQQVIAEQRLLVEDGEDRLEGAARPDGAECDDPDAVADERLVAPPKGDADALADADGGGEVGADGVGVDLLERPVEDDLRE